MKFAYLIMAHDNPRQLIRLLKQLDWKENDIYLHLDKRSACFEPEELKSCIQNATIHIYSRYKVYWADTSQTQCQIFLLKEAVKTFHDYYHLLSGKDFPLKSHEEIVSFFQNSMGTEFVHFESFAPTQKQNYVHYFFLHSLITRSRNERTRRVLSKIQNFTIKIQDRLNIRPHVCAGANWYSITHALANDFIRHRKRAYLRACFFKASDEVVLQTFLFDRGVEKYHFYCYKENKYESIVNYCYKENKYESIVRAIDWNRGKPYVWRADDYSELIQSDAVFGRKFDENVDKTILDLLEEHNRQ